MKRQSKSPQPKLFDLTKAMEQAHAVPRYIKKPARIARSEDPGFRDRRNNKGKIKVTLPVLLTRSHQARTSGRSRSKKAEKTTT
jgi:hypothetical protein